MTSRITIINSALSPSILTIRASAVQISGKKSVETKPPANNQTTLVKAQTLSWENPSYSIPSVMLVEEDSTSLQYSHILQLYRLKYDNTNASTLIVNYGSSKTLLNCLGETTGIKVVLEDFSNGIDVTNSRDGYRPAVSLTFKETG